MDQSAVVTPINVTPGVEEWADVLGVDDPEGLEVFARWYAVERGWAKVSRCASCERYFPYRPSWGHRHQQYCSPACRQRSYRQRKAAT